MSAGRVEFRKTIAMNDIRPTSGMSVLDKAPRLPARGGSTMIRRFDGRSRRTADWDGLRKVRKQLSKIRGIHY